MFEIGSDAWPGISKLVEECGEVLQIAGKLMGTGGKPIHFSGVDLRKEICLELGDLRAAIDFVISHNLSSDERKIVERRNSEKFMIFRKWHADCIVERLSKPRIAIESRIHKDDLTKTILDESKFQHIILSPAQEAYDAHLDRCDACNYDKDCMACEAGCETGHSCNCSHGFDGGVGVKLRLAADEERKR